jgi:putative ABC transport system permease protein
MPCARWVIEMQQTLRQMRYYGRNFIAVALAIVLGVAFVTVSVQAGEILEATTRNAIAVQYAGADIIVTSLSEVVQESDLQTIGKTDGVVTAEKRITVVGDVQSGSRSQYGIIAPVPDTEAIRDELSIDSGRLPQAANEVLLWSETADSLDVEVGDTFSMLPYSGENAPDEPVTLTAVGIMTGSNALAESSAPDMFGWPEQIASWADPSVQSVGLVTVTPGTDPDQVVDSISSVGSGDLVIRTFDQQVDWVLADVSNGTDVLGFGLLAFAIIALFVCGIVIANTFSILVAQRSRNLALLRCVGATREQIRKSVLTEAVILGAVASAIGIVTGLIVTIGAARIFSNIYPAARIATDTPVPLTATIVPFALGFFATMIAAWGPARAATLVAPLAALRPSATLVQRYRIDVRRLGMTLLFLGGGSFLLVVGTLLCATDPSLPNLLIGMLGGIVSFCGVLIGGVLIVPRVIAMLGNLATRVGGAPAFVASSNSARNPKRATATAAAMLIAVTLITMMSVGAATVKSTLGQAIDEESPIDVRLATGDLYASDTNPSPALPTAVVQTVQSNKDVEESTGAIRTMVEIEDESYQIFGIDPEAAQRITRAPDQLAGLADGTAVVPESFADWLGVVDGDRLTLKFAGNESTLLVRVSDWDGDIVVSMNDAKKLAPDAPLSELWLRFEDDVDVSRAMGDLQDSLEPFDRLYIEGGARDKAANYDVLDTMLLIVTALLGVAVIIAIVGVGNTLSLSVIERTRESAILRAIGLTVSQLRVMLAIEGVILALVGSIIGIALGIVYGYAGAVSLLNNAWGVRFSLPLDRIVLIVAIAILAGLLSSVLPAQRAIRTSPVEALAE